jgi:hypothetical protein
MSRRMSRRDDAACILRSPQPHGHLLMRGNLRGNLRGVRSQTSTATTATFTLREVYILYNSNRGYRRRMRTLITRVEAADRRAEALS